MIISILNQKGGCGKTTLAINFSRSLTKRGHKTLLVDSDAQGSSLSWHEKSDGQLLDMTCLSKTTFAKDIKKYVDLYDYVVVDGLANISPLTAISVKCSDFIIIPVTPSPYDIWATKETVNTVKDGQYLNEKLKAFFLISRKIVAVTTNIGKEIYNYLNEMDLPILENCTCQRIDYVNSAKDGTTVLDGHYIGTLACNEINAITDEVLAKL